MKQNLTKEQVLGYLLKNKKHLNITAIAKESNVSNLHNILKSNADVAGFVPKLNQNHANKISKVLIDLINI
jgi:hypothetical protein